MVLSPISCGTPYRPRNKRSRDRRNPAEWSRHRGGESKLSCETTLAVVKNTKKRSLTRYSPAIKTFSGCGPGSRPGSPLFPMGNMTIKSRTKNQFWVRGCTTSSGWSALATPAFRFWKQQQKTILLVSLKRVRWPASRSLGMSWSL